MVSKSNYNVLEANEEVSLDQITTYGSVQSNVEITLFRMALSKSLKDAP